MGKVDQENLTGTEAPLLLHALGPDLEDSDLRAHDHQPVVGDGIARGPQSVAVEGRAHQMAVQERHGGRAVPRLHQAGMIMIESFHVRGNLDRVFPGLRNHHQQSVMDRSARARQQLQGVIETR